MHQVTDRWRTHALLLARAVVAAVFLWHGVPKAFDWGLATDKFIGFGFPGFLGPIVGIVEVICGVLLLLGLLHRWAVLALGAIIIVALATVQVPGGISAGLERDLLVLVMLAVLLTHGPGAFAVARDTNQPE